MILSPASNRTPDGKASLVSPRILTITDERLHAARPEPSPLKTSDLPFKIRIARTEAHLLKAVQVRAQAFLRHAPSFGAQLLEPESADRASGNIVLLAESKTTGAAEGSVRLETNFSYRTEFEKILDLPNFIKGKAVAQASRLGVRPGTGSTLVKMALIKASYRYCLATQIDYILIAARSPVDKFFISLGFEEIFEYPTILNFPGQGEKPLRLFAIHVASGERKWREIRHPLYSFMITEHHPDIEIFDSLKGMWAKPRTRNSQYSQSRLVGPGFDVPAFDFPVV